MRENKSKKLLIVKISLALLGVLVIILMINYLPAILELTVSIDKFKSYILSTGKFGPAEILMSVTTDMKMTGFHQVWMPFQI